VIAKWRYFIETGNPYDIVHRIRRADGVFRWFRVRGLPLKDKEDHIIRWYVLLTDIEDGKRSEDALPTSENRLRLIKETIPAIVTSRDADGKLDYVNRRLEDYTGHSGQEIIDSGVDLIHPDDRDSLLRVWRDSQESGERYELDYRMRRADGVHRWFQVRGAPLKDGEGRVIRWYAVITDIDDGKEPERLFSRARRDLRACHKS
jgi:PAS domain S-box-containing protein